MRNTDPRVIILAVLFSSMLAIPIYAGVRSHTKVLEIQQHQDSQTKFELKTKVEQEQDKVQQLETEKQQLEQKNQELDKQLQAKKEAEARLAAAQKIGGLANCDAYKPLLAKYNWDTRIAMAVMKAESKCKPGEKSDTADHGLMQVNLPSHYPKLGCAAALTCSPGPLYDPETNIRVAYQVYADSKGWGPWVTYKSGAYLQYLN